MKERVEPVIFKVTIVEGKVFQKYDLHSGRSDNRGLAALARQADGVGQVDDGLGPPAKLETS